MMIAKSEILPRESTTPTFPRLPPGFRRSYHCTTGKGTYPSSQPIDGLNFGFSMSRWPFAHIFLHPDTSFLSIAPGRRFPGPTPERVLVTDHQSGPDCPEPFPRHLNFRQLERDVPAMTHDPGAESCPASPAASSAKHIRTPLGGANVRI